MARETSNTSVVRLTPTELEAFRALHTPFASVASTIRQHIAKVMSGEKVLYSNVEMSDLIISGGAVYPLSPGDENRTTHYSVDCGEHSVNEVSAFAKAKGTSFSGLVRQCVLTILSPSELLRAEETRLMVQLESAEKAVRRLEGQLDAVTLKIRALAQQATN